MSEISGIITTGVTLGGAYTSPLTITSTGTVSDAAGDAVYADSAYVNAVLINQGTVSATGGYGHDGVDFRNGGSVDNSRLIQGYFGVRMSNSAGTVTNSGTIVGTFSAVYFSAGGSVGNSGLLQGRYGVFVFGSAGTVTNSGTIAGTIISGVKLGKGGSVDNAADGRIEGTGNASGVSVGGAAGTVTNYGTITGISGIALYSGGSVDNAVGGLVQAINVACASLTLPAR